MVVHDSHDQHAQHAATGMRRAALGAKLESQRTQHLHMLTCSTCEAMKLSGYRMAPKESDLTDRLAPLSLVA